MTILNLGVGLDTSGAKKEMEAFEGWLKGHAPSVSVSLNVAELNKQLKSVTALPVVEIRINSSGVKKELESVMKSVFGQKYAVQINTDSITRDIHNAASAGLKGLKAEVDLTANKPVVHHTPSGATGAAIVAADSVNVASTIKQFEGLISTAVRDSVAFTSDMMAQSFQDVIANQAKKDRVRSNVSASQSFTTEDGIRVSKRVPIADDDEIEKVNAALREQRSETEGLLDLQERLKRVRNEDAIEAGDASRRRKYARAADAADRGDPKATAANAFAAAEAEMAAARDSWDLQIEKEYARRATKSVEEARKLAEKNKDLAKRVESEIASSDNDPSNEGSVAALRERQRQQFETITAGMDEHRKKQLEMERAWNAREAQEAVNRTRGLEKTADQMAAVRAKEELRTVSRVQREDAGQRATLEASKLAEQVKTARGIYNGAKTDMSRMLNEQGSSIAALAVMMQKLPNLDPTTVVNNPAKIEQARQLNKLWQESTGGSQRAEEFMARFARTTAKATDGQVALNKAIMEYYRSAKFSLSGQEKYTPRGVQVGAAAETITKFGADKASSVIGNSSLIAEAEKVRAGTSSLSQYQKKVSEASQHMDIMRRGLNDAHSAARGLAGSLGMVWLTWGQTVPLAGMAAIGFSLRQTYQVGKDVEYQLKFVQALSGGAAIEIAKFNEAVRGTVAAPVDAARALRGLAQNGLEATEALQALPVILKLATAGEMGLSEAALGATGVMAAFNLGVGDLGRVADVFSYAAARSNTSVGAMVEAMKQASTVSDQYGVTLEETAASLAVMAKRNIEGSAAGTAFRNMMTELASPSDKARRALESMGVQVFDSDKKLKGFKSVVEELRGAVISLDQQSRINFLNQIFDERGAKAANALLSDMGLLRSMFDDIAQKSAGFTDTINDALNQSVEGSVRGLITDFQQTAVAVFNEGSQSVKAFIESLREGARSEEFKNFLRTTGELVLNVTQFLVENAKTVAITVAAWLSLRAALAGFTAVSALITTFRALDITLTAVRVSAIAAWGALTGGAAIVVTLAAQYLLLRDNTSEAQKAHDNFQASMTRSIESMGTEIVRLQETNRLLEDRNRLMAGGMTPEQAKKATEGGASDEQSQKMASIEARRKRVMSAQAEYDRWATAPFQGRKQEPWSDEVKWLRSEAGSRNMGVAQAVKEMTRALDAETLSINVAVGQARAKAEINSKISINNEKSQILTSLANLRTENQELAAKGKVIKATMPALSQDMPLEEMKKQYDEYKRLRNSELEHKMAATREDRTASRRAEAEADRLRTLRLANDIKAIKAEEDASRDATRQAEQLSRAKYDPAIYGEATVALLAEIEAQENLTRTYKAQSDAVAKLEALKKRYTGKEEVEKIQEQISEANRLASATAKEIETYKQVQRVKSENRQIKSQTEVGSLKAEQDQDFQRIMREITQKRDNRFSSSPLDTAEASARAKVEEADANRLISLKQRIARLDAGRLKLMDDISKATADDLPTLNQLLEANAQDLEIERETLKTIIEQSRINATIAGDLARKNEEYARSWEGGWGEYWRQFREGAVSNAKIVGDVMNTTTGAMTDMFTKFVTTGKLDFKSFARTIIGEAARLMASKAVIALLNFAANMFFGGMSGGGGGTAVNGSAGTPMIPPNVALKGGVHPYTPGLPGLPLQKFRAGGVSFGPTYTLHAEGARSEAFVPLEDGRNIPVKIVSQPGNGTQVLVNTNIYVTSDGKVSATSQSSNEQGNTIAKAMEQAATEAIIKQLQPGGVLYAKG